MNNALSIRKEGGGRGVSSWAHSYFFHEAYLPVFVGAAINAGILAHAKFTFLVSAYQSDKKYIQSVSKFLLIILYVFEEMAASNKL